MDIQKLKELAQAVIDASHTKRALTVSSHAIALSEFEHALTPELVLSMIDRLEKAKAQLAELSAQEPKLDYIRRLEREVTQYRAAPPAPFVVKLPKRKSMLTRDNFDEDYVTCMAVPISEVIEAIKAAGGEVVK